VTNGFLAPPGAHVKSEPAILCAVAKATLGARSVADRDAWAGNYALIRDHVEAIFPDFEAFNDRIRVPGGHG